MKKENLDSFEKSWQSAFEEANLTPNTKIWDNIEASLPPQLPASIPNSGLGGLAKIATGIVVFIGISTIIYLSSKKVTNQNLKVNHGNSIQIEKSATLGTKPQQQKLVEGTSEITSIKPVLSKETSKIKKPKATIKINVDEFNVSELNVSENITPTIENPIAIVGLENIKLITPVVMPLQNKDIKLEKIKFAPLEIMGNDENYVPYFETTKPFDSNSKGNFWDNFKVRAGVGIGIGAGSGNINSNKPKR